MAALNKACRKPAVAWEGVKSSLPPPLTQEAKDSGEVSRGEKMLYSGTDPESYITEYTFVYEDAGFNSRRTGVFGARVLLAPLNQACRKHTTPSQRRWASRCYMCLRKSGADTKVTWR